MKSELQCKLARLAGFITAAGSVLPALMLAIATATSAHAQGQIASGLISGTGNGPYDYTLTFDNAANAASPIGSIWYAWVPGSFYLPGTPIGVSAPPGWGAAISGNSIQWVADSAVDDITPGGSLAGFSYVAAFSPAQLAAAPNSGLSVAYSGGLFSDTGFTFDVQIAAVPEPSAVVLLMLGASGLWLLGRRPSRAR
jgi:hypothetical protein